MSFSTPPRSPAEPWRSGMYDDAIVASLDVLPERFLAIVDRHPLPGTYPPPIRATRKAEQWSAAIFRSWAYLTDRTREPAHQAELDALLEQTLAAGPDFAKVRATPHSRRSGRRLQPRGRRRDHAPSTRDRA